MNNMVDEIASYEGRIAKVQGAAHTGKTESLIRHCIELLKDGVEPDDIIVLVTSGFAQQAFRNRLIESAGEDLAGSAADVEICTVLDACTNILSTPEAREATGRNPRVLSNSEYKFLLEDIKTSGTSARRLRSMLAYIYRQLSANAPKSTWCVGEEQIVFDMILEYLISEDAMLVYEVPSLAISFIKEAGSAAPKRPYVMCDDFQNLSAAEQTAACLMSKKQLVVAGNTNQTVAQINPYPNPKGFETFDTHRRGVDVFTLSKAYGNHKVHHLANELCKFGSMNPELVSTEFDNETGADIQAIKWANPEEEFNSLTKYLRLHINPDNDEEFESKTCLVVPNKRWGFYIAKALEKRGFLTTTCAVNSEINGDPRYLERSRSLVTYTRLNLLANPDDMVAWRCWCGFGNFLTNSDAWAGLLKYSKEHDLSLADALTKAGQEAKEPFIKSNVLVERWVKGNEFILKNAKRKGFALMRAIGAEECPEFADVISELVGDEDAAEIFRRMQKQATNPSFPRNPHVVHIACPEAMSGCSYDNVIFCGFIDGFFPSREAFEVVSTDKARDAAMNTQRKLIYNAVAKAEGSLMFSFFSKSPLELAEQTKMQVARVKSENGERVGLLRPSCFLTEAGPASPVTLGGQAFMADQENEHAAAEQ